ncbi:helix-turn-helix domain-containing protein [Actinomadura syzygii]|uniref:Helix-turn-helix domain-containing protein n=1 Tax=Actinomadura syzygii TaxID=1427538 RepID=A0A5D0UBD7_9ACTN|nr:helix-turn-helix domain-containing protein [Actinomadura syzygii]TYC15002.1 helix-turn-helix domain-containing protein [Actinomadura syzygii]
MAEPLAYRAEEVPQAFPIGRTALFKLLRTGEIESFKVGRARFVPRQALVDFMARQLAEQNGGGGTAA